MQQILKWAAKMNLLFFVETQSDTYLPNLSEYVTFSKDEDEENKNIEDKDLKDIKDKKY